MLSFKNDWNRLSDFINFSRKFWCESLLLQFTSEKENQIKWLLIKKISTFSFLCFGIFNTICFHYKDSKFDTGKCKHSRGDLWSLMGGNAKGKYSWYGFDHLWVERQILMVWFVISYGGNAKGKHGVVCDQLWWGKCKRQTWCGLWSVMGERQTWCGLWSVMGGKGKRQTWCGLWSVISYGGNANIPHGVVSGPSDIHDTISGVYIMCTAGLIICWAHVHFAV